MKKIFKLMSAALMALAMFVPAQAAELTVYDGSTYGVSYNEYVPIYGYYYDTNNFATQIIYPAAIPWLQPRSDRKSNRGCRDHDDPR